MKKFEKGERFRNFFHKYIEYELVDIVEDELPWRSPRYVLKVVKHKHSHAIGEHRTFHRDGMRALKSLGTLHAKSNSQLLHLLSK